MHFNPQTDVLLALRTHVTSFEDKVYLILLDGDTHTLYYRKDVLEHFGECLKWTGPHVCIQN